MIPSYCYSEHQENDGEVNPAESIFARFLPWVQQLCFDKAGRSTAITTRDVDSLLQSWCTLKDLAFERFGCFVQCLDYNSSSSR